MFNFMTFFARPGETIQEHSLLTYQNSIKLSELNGTDDNKRDLCALSALFHDIGKCVPQFQSHLINKEVKVTYPHNLISALYFYRYIHLVNDPESSNHDVIAHSILFHHPIEKFDDTSLEQYCEKWGYSVNECCPEAILSEMHNIADEFIAIYNNNCCEENKAYRKDSGDFELNKIMYCFNNLAPFVTSSKPSFRNVNFIGICGNLKCADVLAVEHISNISNYFQLSNGTNFSIENFACPNDWNQELFNIQKQYVETILDNYTKGSKTFFEINEPVGFGKTTIYAIASLLLNRKVVVVSPTNNIARNAYIAFNKFLDKFNIKDKVSIGLLYANQWHDFNANNEEFVKKHNTPKERFLECQNDIIITNIDNYMRPLLKSDEKKYMAFDLSYRTAIFDEYHNYYSESALMNCFTTVCRTRKVFGNPLTIMASATREPEIVNTIDGKNMTDKKVLTLPKTRFNCDKRKIQITKRKIDYTIDNENMLVVCNSVEETQRQAELFHSTHPHKKYMIYHSKHTKNDRIAKESKLISEHSENSKDKSLCVFATNIATTGLDISFNKVILTKMPINEMCQSMGRCNRFINEYEYGELIIDFSLTEKNTNEYSAINARYDTSLCDYEQRLVDSNFTNGLYTIAQIDNIFSKITSSESYLKEKSKYFNNLEIESGKMMNQLSFTYKKDYDNVEGVEYLASRVNLRTKKNFEDELFIWCKGLKEDEYVNERIKIGQDEAAEMLNYLDNNKQLQKKYFNNFKYKFNNFNKSRNKAITITQDLINMAKCSKTPFIVQNRSYDSINGLRKIK